MELRNTTNDTKKTHTKHLPIIAMDVCGIATLRGYWIGFRVFFLVACNLGCLQRSLHPI